MRVLLVDDNALFLEGLQDLLSANDIEVVGTAENGREALRKAEELNPEVVLMDIQMPEDSGIEATRHLKARLPHVKVVMLTVSQDDEHLFEAIKAGAVGYLLKGLDRERFLELLTGIANGESPLSPGLAAKILNEFARREERWRERETAAAKAALLTPRNAEILRCVASGLTYKEVGGKLGLSHAAVKYHMGEITARLQLENKSQVIAFAAELGLLSPKRKN